MNLKIKTIIIKDSLNKMMINFKEIINLTWKIINKQYSFNHLRHFLIHLVNHNKNYNKITLCQIINKYKAKIQKI
jgi:hypothetical protein